MKASINLNLVLLARATPLFFFALLLINEIKRKTLCMNEGLTFVVCTTWCHVGSVDHTSPPVVFQPKRTEGQIFQATCYLLRETSNQWVRKPLCLRDHLCTAGKLYALDPPHVDAHSPEKSISTTAVLSHSN